MKQTGLVHSLRVWWWGGGTTYGCKWNVKNSKGILFMLNVMALSHFVSWLGGLPFYRGPLQDSEPSSNNKAQQSHSNLD